jgi:hypothetical protein
MWIREYAWYKPHDTGAISGYVCQIFNGLFYTGGGTISTSSPYYLQCIVTLVSIKMEF